MELKTIGFRPDARLRGELVGVKASRSKYARHSESLSEVEIDMRLKEYFADHDVMLRYDFQEVCCMTRTTANVCSRFMWLQRVITGCLVMCFGGKWKRFELCR